MQIELNYYSRLLRMIKQLDPEANDDEIDKALEAVTPKQANMIFALCKQHDKQAVQKLVKDLNIYAK